jgi:hypothetical protein
MVGVAKATIVAVEVGALKLSQSLSNRIAVATGINPSWLMGIHGFEGETWDSKPMDTLLRPYTWETWKAYHGSDKLFRETLPAGFNDLSNRATLEIDQLLRAAARKGREAVAFQFINDAILKCLEDLNIRDTFLAERNYGLAVSTLQENQTDGEAAWGKDLAPRLLSPEMIRELENLAGAKPLQPVPPELEAALLSQKVASRLRYQCLRKYLDGVFGINEPAAAKPFPTTTPLSGQPSAPAAPPVESPKTSKPRRASRARGSA